MHSGFAQEMTLRTQQCDLSGHMSVSSLFQWMQEIAGDDSDRLGMGRDFMDAEQVFWVLSRLAITVHGAVKRNELLRMRTWHGDTVRYIFPRFYTLENEKGELLAEASSLWMLIDAKSRQIVMPSLRGWVLPPRPEALPEFPSPGRIIYDFPLDRQAVRIPVYSDFDINNHMNNARYPLWICDLFPPALFREKYVSRMQLNFQREIVDGDHVRMQYGQQADRFVVIGEVNGISHFEAAGEFSPLP